MMITVLIYDNQKSLWKNLFAEGTHVTLTSEFPYQNTSPLQLSIAE